MADFLAQSAKNSTCAENAHVGLPSEEDVADRLAAESDPQSIAHVICNELRARADTIRELSSRVKTLEAKLAQAVEALEPFSKAAGIIAWTERATTVKYDDAAPFRSGLAWRAGEGTPTLTIGDFRRARSASAAARGETR